MQDEEGQLTDKSLTFKCGLILFLHIQGHCREFGEPTDSGNASAPSPRGRVICQPLSLIVLLMAIQL